MRESRNAVVALFLAAASMSCSGGGGGGGPGPDTTPPRVTSTNPGDGATSVAKGVAITATFSEALDPATVSTATFSLGHGGDGVRGSVAWNAGTRTATFTPTSALALSTPYTATIAGVEDLAGNPMDGAHVWTFETAAPAAGDLDPTFGALGIARTDLGSGTFDGARGMTIQPDDKIVVVGGSGDRSLFTLVRYDADGGLDPSFGPAGVVTTAIASCGAIPRAVALQPDGKIVAAGSCAFDAVVVRYEPDGTLDSTFGESGTKLLSLGGDETANAVAIDAAGNVVVAGETDVYSTSTNSSDFFVARLTADGALDGTFSGDGVSFVDFKPASYTEGSALHDVAYAVTIQGDGRILVAGHAENIAWLNDVALALLNSDGSIQAKATHGYGNLWNNDARAVALQPDGRIVTAGMLDTHYLGVMRFTSSLDADVLFGTIGSVKVDVRNDGTSSTDYGHALRVQPDGKIVAAGTVRSAYNPYPRDFALARVLSNGMLDTGFGTGGKVVLDGGGADDVLVGVGLQSDGKIVVAGTSGGDFFVARFVP